MSCQSAQPIARLTGLTHLPINTNALLIQTYLAKQGPLIVNVDASAWSIYESGMGRKNIFLRVR